MENTKRLLLAILLVVGIGATPLALDALPEIDPTAEAVATLSGKDYEEVLVDNETRELARPLARLVQEDRENFAGAWFNRSGTIALHIMVVRNADPAAVDRIEALVPAGLPVEFIIADYSQSQLEAVVKSLEEASLAGDSRITFIGLSQRLNRVIVGSAEDSLVFRQELFQRYGKAVVLEVRNAMRPAACNGITDCTPWRGAIAAQVIQGSGTNQGTVMAWARYYTGVDEYYLITSGHAGTSLYGQKFWHNGIYVGRSTLNSLSFSSPKSDSQRVYVQSALPPQATRIRHNGTNTSWNMLSKENFSAQLEGDPVCKAGVGQAYPGLRCDYIDLFSASYRTYHYETGHGPYITVKWSDSLGVSGGDSGATIFYSRTFMGIGVAGDDPVGGGAWSTSNQVESDLNVTICVALLTNPPCAS